MKKRDFPIPKFSFFLLSLLFVGFTACSDDDLPGDDGDANGGNGNGGENTTKLLLTCTPSVISLQEEQAATRALTLTWNEGLENVKEYSFMIDLKEKNFSTPVSKKIGPDQERIITYTHTELNELILSTWPDIEAGSRSVFQVRVIATDTEGETLTSNIPELVIITYSDGTDPVDPIDPLPPFETEGLWITGDATGGLAIEDRIFTWNQRSGKYEWAGILYPQDEFSFVVNIPEYLTGIIGKADSDINLYFTTDWKESITTFTINEEENYIIEIDLENLRININKNTPAFDDFYGVCIGSDMKGYDYTQGWLDQDNIDINRFSITTYFQENDVFKLSLNPEWGENWWWGKWLMAPYENAPVTETMYVISWDGSGPDNKWQIPADGEYHIEINLRTEHIYITQL